MGMFSEGLEMHQGQNKTKTMKQSWPLCDPRFPFKSKRGAQQNGSLPSIKGVANCIF